MNENIKSMVLKSLNEAADFLEKGKVSAKVRVGVTLLGSEHGFAEVLAGAESAQAGIANIEVVVIGPSGVDTKLEKIIAENEAECHQKMDEALEKGVLQAAVTMHYNFPIGVSTVGLAVTPGRGKDMFVATTTGTTASERITAMVKNAVLGIAVAKACGVIRPSVGILNVDGARQVERILQNLKQNGYDFLPADSMRQEGGMIMRGNDLLAGTPDVLVQDTLTGNLLMKIFSSFNTGGNYEALGYGYGPGVGEGYKKIINIVSRASGGPVIAGAISYAAMVAGGNLPYLVNEELNKAKKAGLEVLLAEIISGSKEKIKAVEMPTKKPVCEQIAGIDVLDLENAQHLLWKAGIYAETGMGCTGPIILVAKEDLEKATAIFKKEKIF